MTPQAKGWTQTGRTKWPGHHSLGASIWAKQTRVSQAAAHGGYSSPAKEEQRLPVFIQWVLTGAHFPGRLWGAVLLADIK